MSLILDALKKLEQEKTARKGKSIELGAAVIAGKASRPPSRRSTVALVCAAVAVTAAATMLLMKLLSPATEKPEAASLQPAALLQPLPVTVQAASPASLPAEVPLKPPAPSAPPAPRQPAAPPAAEREAESAHSTLLELKVTGIAWQEERPARRAVVNGALVSEGNMVAGALVKEILPGRVRFAIGNRQVEIENNTPFH